MVRKPSKTKSTKEVSLRYSYWEDWGLVDYMTGICKFKIPKSNEKKISKLYKEVIEQHKYEKIPDLIKVEPNCLRNDLISIQISRYMQLSRTDTTAMNIHAKIEKALHGDLRGKTPIKKTMEMAKLDLSEFKEMVKDKLSGKTVQEIINTEPTRNRIWNSYIKISRKILNSVGKNEKNKDDWEFVYLILGKMIRQIGKPVTIIHFPTSVKDKLRWVLIKGTKW